jgi:hypothetical protein
VDLREEGGDRVLSSDLVSLRLDEIEPLAIVDLAVDPPAATEDLHRDLLEASPTQPGRQVLKPQLRRHPQDGSQLLEQVLISRRLLFELIGQAPQSVGLFALLPNSPCERVELLSKVLANASAAKFNVTHGAERTGRAGRSLVCTCG